jgi:hypothetical protein
LRDPEQRRDHIGASLVEQRIGEFFLPDFRTRGNPSDRVGRQTS